MSNNSDSEFKDEGASRPIPSFNTSNIKLSTLSPNPTTSSATTPAYEYDYLDYEQKRGLTPVMFGNTGVAYLLGIAGGGIYGLGEGLKNAPSNRFRIKFNSVLNHCSRHGSRVGNMVGCWSVLYSLFEYAADSYELDRYTGPIQPAAPPLAAFLTGVTYKIQAGPRVAALAGTIGLGSVGLTYAAYSVLGIPYGQKGWLFF
jgi:import inner membrane translocase subunit TIM23